MPRIAIIITGKVQGVYFRKYTQWKAEELGITGFVRNEPDGTVLIEAEGAPDALEAMEKWCHLGSPLSKVESVQYSAIEEKGSTEFELVH